MKHEILHIPVLQQEILKILNPKKGDNFIDATINGGGHASAILEKINPTGKILGIDLDCNLIKALKIKNIKLVCDNYINMKKIVEENKFKNVKGILFDLGMSSWHLEKSGRGFTFQKNEQLDMRYNRGQTAKDIVNKFKERELADIFWKYGDERFSRRIAKNIVEKRRKKPIETTFELVEIIQNSVPRHYQHRRLHFATKTFQALRIFVNKELDNLQSALPQALDILDKKGILIIISFHSLEDRLVKNFVKAKTQEGQGITLTKKPIMPSFEEIKKNPRSRSAKLRALQKI